MFKIKKDEKLTFAIWYDFLMLFLCLYVVIEFSLEIILKIPENTLHILNTIDFWICIIFIFDWVFFFFKTKQKKYYFKTRLFDLIASIPFVQILRLFRVLRFIRIFRTLKLLRGMRGTIPIVRKLLANPARAAITIYISLTSIIYFYCSLGMYSFEKDVNSSVNNFSDALWMGFTTMTSVGYGDVYPVTNSGRILAGILVITGMGLFGLVTAELAVLIVSYVRKRRKNIRKY